MKPCFRFTLFLLTLLMLSDVNAFHASVYLPRVPEILLAELRLINNPQPAIPENIEQGRQIYFGQGLCVTCHGRDGQGVNIPGHSPRDFTDATWQAIRSDGELMWILENGSPGTGMPVRVERVITKPDGWNVIHFIRTFVSDKR